MPQKKTKSNPDALPLGMVADTYRGQKYMGFTCAACHSSFDPFGLSLEEFDGIGKFRTAYADGTKIDSDEASKIPGVKAIIPAPLTEVRFAGAPVAAVAGVFVSGSEVEQPENKAPRIFPTLKRVFALRSALSCTEGADAKSEKAVFSRGFNGAARED